MIWIVIKNKTNVKIKFDFETIKFIRLNLKLFYKKHIKLCAFYKIILNLN
jgi:hypothetical protein